MVKSRWTRATSEAKERAHEAEEPSIKCTYSAFLNEMESLKVETLKNVTAPSNLLDLTIKTVTRGSIVYTDKFRSYDSLVFFRVPSYQD